MFAYAYVRYIVVFEILTFFAVVNNLQILRFYFNLGIY